MPLVLADRVRETTTTTGTGTISLAGPVSGFQGFSTAIGNANTTYYTIVDAATGAWEVGLGTYTSSGSTLARTTVLSSSNNDALVPFASGVKDVFVTQPAERAVYVLGAGTGLAAGAAAFTANGVPYADSTSTLATGANLTYAEGGSNQLTVTSASASYFTSTVGANTSYFGTNGTGTYVGSGTNVPVVFYQNNTEGMRLTSTGLGIGLTPNALFKLDVNGNARISSAGAQGLEVQPGAVTYLLAYNRTTSVYTPLDLSGEYLRFSTNNGSERMRITAAGDVGIGTISPVYQTQIYGSGQTTAALTDAGNKGGSLLLNTPTVSAGDGGALLLGAGGSGAKPFAAIKGLLADGGGNTTGSIAFSTRNATGDTALTERMRLDFSGNLGIGTSSPSTPLDVFSAANGIIKVRGGSATNQGGGFYVWKADNTGSLAAFGDSARIIGGTPDQAVSIFGSNVPITFYTNAERMRITAAGDVGIGTSSPAQKLVVSNAGAAGFEFDPANAIIQTYNRSSGAYIDMRQYALNIRFFTGSSPTETMRLDSSGNLGIGTISPSSFSGYTTVSINNATNGAILNLLVNGTETARLQAYSGIFNVAAKGAATNLTFETNGAERMRLDSSGNLGIGTTNPLQKLVVSLAGAQGLEISPDAVASAPTLVAYNRSGGAYVQLSNLALQHVWQAGASPTEAMRLNSSGALLVGSSSAILSSTNRGNITVIGSASAILSVGTSTSAYTYLYHDASGAEVWNNQNTYLRFGTNNTERARITSEGDLLVGTTSSAINSSPGIKLNPAQSGANAPTLGVVTAASTNTTVSFSAYSTGAGAYRFYVDNAGTIFATSTAISAISDQRLKENIQDLDAGLDKIMALKPRKFDWKAGKGKDIKDDRGFIAQEFEQVFPEMIDNWKDPAPEGEEPYKSVRADLIPVLVKAIQELKAEFDAYKATHP